MKTFYSSILILFIGYFVNAQDPTAFIMTYELTNPIDYGLSITVPIQGDNYTIDLGDGTILSNQNGYSSSFTHTYNSVGTYTVTVTGDFHRVSFDTGFYNDLKLKTIEQWGTAQWSTMEGAFKDCINLTVNATDVPDLSQVTNMSEMFYGASNFNSPVNNWDVSNVTNMYRLFAGATSFNQPLSNWDVSNVTNMDAMFGGVPLFNQPLNNWDVSNVTSMIGMFAGDYQGTTAFNQPLDNWDTSNVTNMSHMFHWATSFNQPLNSWDVSNVTDMYMMFHGVNLFNYPLDNWDTSSVTEMSCMFMRATSFNQPLNNWDVSNVQSCHNMFNEATSFNQPLNDWDISNVLQMYALFYKATSFNEDISAWDFNTEVYLHSNTDSHGFLSLSGIDSENYDKLLLKFAQLGFTYKTIQCEGVHYCDSAVRTYLEDELNWQIWGDSQGEECIGNSLTGTIHFDENANGCDENDVAISSLLVSGNNDSAFTYATTPDETGQYNLLLQDGTYTISVLNLPTYFTAIPATSTVSFTGFGNTQSLDFCLTTNETINDLNITLLPISDARPGFEVTYQLVASNLGTQTVSNVGLNLSFDTAAQTFISATETADTATSGQLGFTLATLQPFETRTINIVMQTVTPPAVNGGDILNFTATVTPDTGDYTPDDNTFGFAQTVVNSFDPNDKRVVQGDEITIDQADGYLDYIIRFQNTGTASAIKVRIADDLSDMLDWTTLTPLSASHNYTVRITDGNQVEFIFDNINLPAQQDDDAGSNGYIAYKIKPVQNVAVGDIIDGNAASIYFDYNLPIITNAVATEVVSPTSGTNGFTLSSLISLYPNPTNDILNIKKNGNVVLQGATIFNLQGRELLSFGQDTETINLKSLQSGIYLIAIKTNKGVLNQRLIKN